jgi:hypothetical protein
MNSPEDTSGIQPALCIHEFCICRFNQLQIKVVFKNCTYKAGCQWLMLIILATWEGEIGRIEVLGMARQIFHETPSPK